MREAKALAGLHECLGSHEQSLLANATSIPESLVLASLCLLLEIPYFVYGEVKAMARLQECLGSYEPSLLSVDVTLC